MKKSISFLVIVSMIIGCIMPMNAIGASKNPKSLPVEGEVVSGFKTIKIGAIDIINSKTAVFEHEKTGAELIFIQNNDKDRTFDISFKTPALDNTGVNHVLEHATVSGSKKYPFKNILFTVMNQTYSTFVNAFTAPNFTSYPIASMSEAQLLKFTDMYMDCVFNPYIYEDKKIFDREAWRYEKLSKDTPLTMNGTVYSEMKNATSSIQTSALYNSLDALFPNSIVANISGGNPEDLSKLTYEQMIQTHDTYYHPSNALIVLYGDLDYRTFLNLIDKEYLSKYDKKTIEIETGEIKPLTQSVTKNYDFPVALTTNTTNTSQLDYSYAMTGLSNEETVAMMIFSGILNHDASPLKQAFKKSDIGADISVSFISQFPQPILSFTVQNADPTKKDALKQLVDNTMKDISKIGFDSEVVDAVIASSLFSDSNITEIPNLGYNIAMTFAQWWATYDNLDYFDIFIDGIETTKAKADSKYFQELTQKYIINNKHSALIGTIPKAGLAEQKAQEFDNSLKAVENAMTDEEVQKLVDKTNEFNAWNAIEVDQAKVKDLQAVTIAELPEDIKTYDIEDKTIDNVRYLSADANVDLTTGTEFTFDTSAVPADKLHYLNLFASLLGRVSTKQYDLSKLNVLNTRYLNNFSSSLNVLPKKDEKAYTPILKVQWFTLKEDYTKAMELMKEILLNTNLDNTEEITKAVTSLKSNFKSSFTQNPLNLLSMRNVSSFNDSFNYLEHTTYLEYYKFLDTVEELLKTSPQTVSNELKAVRDIVLNKTNLIVKFVGNRNNKDLIYTNAETIINDLPSKKIVKQDYSKLPKPAKSEGIVLDSTVQHNIISAPYEAMGVEFNGKYMPLMLALSENYLTPKLRYQNGTYSNIEQVNKDFICMFTYADPLIKETFDVYSSISDFVQSYDIKQEDLDRYIMKAFGNNIIPAGELNGAWGAIEEKLQGYTQEDKTKILKEIKSATVADFKAMGDMFDKLSENGSISTLGSLSKLKENESLYKDIISIEQ